MSFIILLLIIAAVCDGDLSGIMTLLTLGIIGTMFFGGGNVVGVILNDK